MQLELGKSYKLTVKNDGIQIEEIKGNSQFWSGRVICVETDDWGLTIGKVYNIRNGIMFWDTGEMITQAFDGVEDLNNFFDKNTHFIQYEGEDNH